MIIGAKRRVVNGEKSVLSLFYNNFLPVWAELITTFLTYVFKVVIPVKYVVFESEFALEFLF